PRVTAYSDPALPGYGHYAYDHEGTPARRVTHIDRGVFRGFMNSRQTAAVFGGAPNRHFKATSAALVPVIRMSNTVFDGGDADPARIISDVDRGYYLVGHRIPSIPESRENCRISARQVYAIERGERRHHRRASLGFLRRDAHQGRALDAAARRRVPRLRDQQDRPRRLLLNVPARAVPGGQQRPLRARVAQPAGARGGPPRLARE